MFHGFRRPVCKKFVDFQLGKCEPIIKGRIAKHALFWKELGTPDWLIELLIKGVKIFFEKEAPKIVLPNNKSAVDPKIIPWMRSTILEYERFGFIKRVSSIPYCVMPLQVKESSEKVALI